MDYENEAGADISTEAPEPFQPGDRAGSVRDAGERHAESDRRQRQQDRLDQIDSRRPRRLDRGDGHRSSVRESVKAAVAEVRERDERTRTASPRSAYQEQPESNVETHGRQSAAERAERTADAQTGDHGTPPSWIDPNVWQGLRPEARQQIAIREQVHGELNAVFGPHVDRMQAKGLSPSQAVDVLLRWNQAIERHPAAGLAMLAAQLGIDPRRPLVSAENVGQVQQEIQNFISNDRQIENERQTRAIVENFGATRPHFEEVRPIMRKILSSAAAANTVKPYLDSNGQVDLQKLYNDAIATHPTLRRQAATNGGRTAPAGNRAAPRSRAAPARVGQRKPPTSVRESLEKAIQDLRA